MPRANRSIEPGHTYHLTHRCHDRSFLFRFAIDRQAYRAMLHERLRPFGISLLNYCITSNHTHLLLRIRDQPSQWEYAGYRELMGLRKRNRLIDTDALCRAVELDGPDGLAEFRRRHQTKIEGALTQPELRREPIWTESIAIGEQNWIRQVGGAIRNRMHVVYERQPERENTWRVREPSAAYSDHGLIFPAKNQPIPAISP